ncbi:unnamed protein product, partial [Phaeothamnion confervicola]
MEYIGALTELSRRNVERDDPSLLSSGRIELATGNGWDGLPDKAPFDAIHVGAAAASVPIQVR